MATDIIYKLKIPSKDIWFVQNTLENFDGLALLTEAKMENNYGTMDVLTNDDFNELLLIIFEFLKVDIPELEIRESL